MSGPELATLGMAETWKMALKLQTFTARELIIATGLYEKSVRVYLKNLVADGHLVDDGADNNRQYRVVEKKPTRFGPKSQRLWRAARRHRLFSAADLCALSSLPEDPVTVEEAARYCEMLVSAGYVRVRQKAIRGQNPARYQLLRNTGPKPPEKRRITVVLDPNTGEIIPGEAYRMRQDA